MIRALKGAHYDRRIIAYFVERTISLFLSKYLGFGRKPTRQVSLLPFSWLDENLINRIATIAEAVEGQSFGPKIDGAQSSKEVLLPPVHLYHFTKACCCGGSSAIVQDNHLIMERVPSVDPLRCKYSDGQVRRYGVAYAVILRGSIDYIDKGIFLGGNGAFNYYHWMIEILPKLQFLSGLGTEYENYPLLVDESVEKTPTFQEALNMLKGDRSVVVLKSGMSYYVNSLLHLNSPNLVPFNLREGHQFSLADFPIRQESVQFIRNTFLSLACSSHQENTPISRIFLARRGDRRNYNQDEVFSVLQLAGFVAVYLEDHSFAEQVRMISQADMMVGPTGAAWTNLIFCSSGTKCLCWMDDRLSEFSCFSNLAHCVGADLRYIIYRLDQDSSCDFYSAHYTVDVQDLKLALDGMLQLVQE